MLWQSRKNMNEELGEYLYIVTKNVRKTHNGSSLKGNQGSNQSWVNMAFFLNEKIIQTLQKDKIKKTDSTKCW